MYIRNLSLTQTILSEKTHSFIETVQGALIINISKSCLMRMLNEHNLTIVPDNFPKLVIQLEFEVMLPWFLEEKST
jgi:hypothetical protein